MLLISWPLVALYRKIASIEPPGFENETEFVIAVSAFRSIDRDPSHELIKNWKVSSPCMGWLRSQLIKNWKVGSPWFIIKTVALSKNIPEYEQM